MDDSDSASDIYYSLPESGPVELKVKRSRFIARGLPVADETEARRRVEGLARREHKANHHCWAARFASGEEQYNDDGEPAGTAGMPILQVLRGNDLQQSLIVVTRYFGGIKLGTGGLSRAYADASRLLLQETTPVENLLLAELVIQFEWSRQAAVYRLVNRFEARVAEQNAGKEARLSLQVRRSRLPQLRAELIDALQGQVRFPAEAAS